MRSARLVRIALVLLAVAAGLWWVLKTSVEPSRVNLYMTAVVVAVTTIYALFTYEILLQNQSMAKASVDSVTLAERGLRFSYSPNLQYETINTKDPTFKATTAVTPVDTEYYRKAVAEQGGEQQEKEFIFAIVKNVGRGAATSLTVTAEYNITDSSAAGQYTVRRNCSVQILQPDHAVALCIFFSKVPTRDDKVRLVEAKIGASDIYRDALKEEAHTIVVDVGHHHHESESGCVIQLE